MSMQTGEFAQRFIQMLRPENVGNAAQTAITWLKLPPAPIGIKPLRLANFPATLGRLGALEVRLAQASMT
jgi:L-ornithine Nalpha-acyltransferase